eukprot:gnl/TRDRNA2_/TRDRNA2_159911_c0_seq2.p1 gnl/TRDRNA2_/TRDRNA2_159911_c0~~gnl/TRDRNA2_/TRDRNA2_159911_c0_seq2.p1  ORF type:complete len:197 (+),score=28.44 gnl/TRDRNA2_/TRDRNA2_159911_c0_seq2:107-697(+)
MGQRIVSPCCHNASAETETDVQLLRTHYPRIDLGMLEAERNSGLRERLDSRPPMRLFDKPSRGCRPSLAAARPVLGDERVPPEVSRRMAGLDLYYVEESPEDYYKQSVAKLSQDANSSIAAETPAQAEVETSVQAEVSDLSRESTAGPCSPKGTHSELDGDGYKMHRIVNLMDLISKETPPRGGDIRASRGVRPLA